MATSIWDTDVQAVFDGAKRQVPHTILLDDQMVEVSAPFHSPGDWRDQWIYFLLLDRFNNPLAPPHQLPYDSIYGEFQGGTFNGVRERLPYLQELGVGAIWLSPVFKNCQYSPGSYHGYGIQDFLSVEPRFSSSPTVAEQELRALVDAAHALNIYVIFDIVLNHTGDVFAYQCHTTDALCQASAGSEATYSATPYDVAWRDEHGVARSDWPIAEIIQEPARDAVVWPRELRKNSFFRRQGLPQTGGNEVIGDFASLKQMLTADPQLQTVLIRAYQYAIAKYDIDGFRVDTLKFIDRDFARSFGNATREFALSIGKRNFFTFGEVYDNEQKIARFIGRNAADPGDLIGIDAALDYPLFFTLPGVVKGMQPPSNLAAMYQARKQAELDILSSHGEATNYFVTFLDNHDQMQRFYYSSATAPHQYDDQLMSGLACLFALQGIPCIYYGTEQGLHGSGNALEAVREALWGKANAFDTNAVFYQALKTLSVLRDNTPALRYGRQYFRPVSGDQTIFGISSFAPGVVAFSRILNDEEVIVVLNTDTQKTVSLAVLVDTNLHSIGTAFHVLYSNKTTPVQPEMVQQSPSTTVVYNSDGTLSHGSVNYIIITLQPMEVQILGNAG